MLRKEAIPVAGELKLRVINADGTQSNLITLSVENGPLITRLSRKRIKAGKGDCEITLGGVAFKPDIILFVNDLPVVTSFVDDASFTARIPAAMIGQPAKVTLQARNANGGRSNKITLKVVE